MNTKTIISILLAIVVVLGGYLFYTVTMAPAKTVAENCPAGTTRVGEDCMSLKDACAMQGSNYRFDEATQQCVSANTTTDTTANTDTTAKTMQIKIALLNTTGEGTGKSVGCDKLAMVSRTVPKSVNVLTAAMNALFTEPATASQPSTVYNFIARTNSTLKFDHATVASGTASIYLTGKLSGLAGVCDDPRAASQIVETAMQFPTVQKVQLYLNNEPTTLTPNERGE